LRWWSQFSNGFKDSLKSQIQRRLVAQVVTGVDVCGYALPHGLEGGYGVATGRHILEVVRHLGTYFFLLPLAGRLPVLVGILVPVLLPP
jgi:hypothetical protein